MVAPIFNPPPGWPRPPQGWRPGPGWAPDPSWPAAPPGWAFWIDPVTGAPAPLPGASGAPRRRRLPLVLGLVGAGLALIVVITLAVGAVTLLRPPPADVAPGTEGITTVDQAIEYYDEQKALVMEFLRDEPFGYESAILPMTFDELDSALEFELADDPSVDTILRLAGDYPLLLEDLRAALADWQLEYAAKAENDGNATGTDAEAVLDRVSGGISGISIDEVDPCEDTEALACVKGDSLVYVPSSLAGLSSDEFLAQTGLTWESLMTHEFAHVIQNKYKPRLIADPTFTALFPPVHPDLTILNYDLEHSADCMAALRVEAYDTNYPGECTPEQTAFAATMWDGSFYVG